VKIEKLSFPDGLCGGPKVELLTTQEVAREVRSRKASEAIDEIIRSSWNNPIDTNLRAIVEERGTLETERCTLTEEIPEESYWYEFVVRHGCLDEV